MVLLLHIITITIFHLYSFSSWRISSRCSTYKYSPALKYNHARYSGTQKPFRVSNIAQQGVYFSFYFKRKVHEKIITLTETVGGCLGFDYLKQDLTRTKSLLRSPLRYCNYYEFSRSWFHGMRHQRISSRTVPLTALGSLVRY